MNLNRRDFMRLGGAGLALGSLNSIFNVGFMRQALHAAITGPNPKKLIFIFQRGGNDSVGTIIPHGDPQYNLTNRPTLYLNPATTLPLSGNTFVEAHPKLAKAVEVYDAGELAIIHQVAYPQQSRSHFSSEHYWQNAIPGDEQTEEGWLNRLIAGDPTLANHPIPGASISFQLQLMFKGPLVVPQFQFLRDYSLGTGAAAGKLVGAVPSMGSNGSGLQGVYSRAADTSEYDQLVRDNGVSMGASLDVVQALPPYTPANGATYPLANGDPGDDPDFQNGTSRTFFEQLRDGVRLLKQTDCRLIGIDLGGWDTHSNQASANGQPRLLHTLAHGIRSAALDCSDPANDIWNDTLIVVASEFGRTSKENASLGTDHAEAGVMFVAGGNVNGGVYNGSAGNWSGILSVNNRYLGMRTDFRAVYAEILQRHFGISPMEIDSIIPGWNALNPALPQNQFVNILP